MMALFPCNILYRFFGEDLLPQCTLDEDNMYYQWLAYYVSDEYIRKTENENERIFEIEGLDEYADVLC